MDTGRVGIVVVTYNRLKLLKEVIDSLRAQTYQNHRIVVVNNGSTDGTAEWLDEQTDLKIITQENLGGAGGFFTGMKYVAENDFDYCWVMDDDVICKANALEELISAYHAKEGVGYVCSKVEGIDGSPMNTPAVDVRPTANGYPYYCELIDRQMIKVVASTFVSVLLSTNTIRELGLPIKEFFIWGDDTEYTQRVSARYECYMACKSVVVHKRAIQGGLNFLTETDPKRLKNFFYSFRNIGYIELKSSTAKHKTKWTIRRTRDALRLMLRGDFKRAKIILKAMIALMNFHPQICFPARL